MSLTREDDRQKNGCPSRGLGIAAAAIGVGVGAALYYFFNKRTEQPNTEGSTSDWSSERAQNLHQTSDEYITISENETSDTSINDNDIQHLYLKEDIYDSGLIMSDYGEYIDSDDMTSSTSSETITHQTSDEYITISENETSDTSINDNDIQHLHLKEDVYNSVLIMSDYFEYIDSDDMTSSTSSEIITEYSSDAYTSLNSSDISSIYHLEDSENMAASYSDVDMSTSSSSNVTSDSETSDYDIASSSLGIPEHEEIFSSPLQRLFPWAYQSNDSRKYLTEEQQMAMIRQEQFRDRAWTLEQCSICFDVMLREQEVMRLSCAHIFHTQCILPWLQRKQTCPVCREAADF